MEEYICEAGFFLQSKFYFLFTHRREKRKTPFCSPQDLVFYNFLSKYEKFEKGELEVISKEKLKRKKDKAWDLGWVGSHTELKFKKT